eukprot:TRINITY_DN10712_c0_g1_i3.p1 TRINITY_DN10712_c0_g1~~TRINITY_DN10712_c0_g1_i3.p1  ORF type:complete len:791 (+),score=154.72 TRINITY_DN10712_c0_g1_i3:150-2522(+)
MRRSLCLVVLLAVQLSHAVPTHVSNEDDPSEGEASNIFLALGLGVAFVLVLALCASKNDDAPSEPHVPSMETNPAYKPSPVSIAPSSHQATTATATLQKPPPRPSLEPSPPRDATIRTRPVENRPLSDARTPTSLPPASDPSRATLRKPMSAPTESAPTRPPPAGFVDPLFAGSGVRDPNAPAVPKRGSGTLQLHSTADPTLPPPDYENAPSVPARNSLVPPVPRDVKPGAVSPGNDPAAPPVQRTNKPGAPPPRPSKDSDSDYLMPLSPDSSTQNTGGSPQPPPRRAPKGYTLVTLGDGDPALASSATPHSPQQMALTSASVQVADMQGQLSNRQLPRNRLNLTEQLGSGHFGDVFRATYTEISGHVMDVAVKSLKDAEDEKATRLFLLEAQIMMEFNHPNVLKLIGVTTVDMPWCMVTEMCEFGDLRELLVTLDQHDFILNCEEKLRLLGDVAAGMHYLSTLQFIHRDLAARNCLVTADGRVKIGDFGMSRLVLADEDYYKSQATDMLPLRWMAVESMENLKFTIKSDVWSFGVVGFEIFSYGGKPYGKISNLILASEVAKGMRPLQPSRCPDDVYALFKHCWHHFPEGRPTFREVYEMVADLHAKEIKRAKQRVIRDLGVMFRAVRNNPEAAASDPYKSLPDLSVEEDENGDDPYKKLEGGHKTYIETKFLPPLPTASTQGLELDTMPFFHGNISRTAAERLLMSQGRIIDLEGTFLVRTSSSNPNDYTLSVIFEAKVWHYRIQKLDSGRYRFYGSEYDSLPELINYHCQFKGTTLLNVLTRHCEVA